MLNKHFTSEKEFEDEVVVPLLNKSWGIELLEETNEYPSFERQKQVEINIGSRNERDKKPDFFVSFDRSHHFLIEAKLKITTELELSYAVNQSHSYAAFLPGTYYLIASPEGVWIYEFIKGPGCEDKLVKQFSFPEIVNEINGNNMQLLETLLKLEYPEDYEEYYLYKRKIENVVFPKSRNMLHQYDNNKIKTIYNSRIRRAIEEPQQHSKYINPMDAYRLKGYTSKQKDNIFWGAIILSIIVNPIIALFSLFSGKPKRVSYPHRRYSRYRRRR